MLELTHCSSGEMAARVARLLGFIISPDSLLPLQRLEKFPFFPPRIWGVDGFALRKVRTSGTPVVDLERRCPIGLSEGISAQEISPNGCWAHPQVDVLARGRAWATVGPAKLLSQKPNKWPTGFIWSKTWETP